MTSPEFHVFLPQMRMDFPALVTRAVAAEASGFHGIALMDHLAPPMAENQDMWEAMTTAAWLLARTESLIVSHLVLCDSLRHPALLARQAVSLDHASGGRFELGIGWGSVPAELATFGIGSTDAKVRVGRLKETLEVLAALWTGEVVDYQGTYFTLTGAQQKPTPTKPIPLIIGGVGKRTLELVAAHADWWNLPIYGLNRLESLRPQTGNARLSVQLMVAFVDDESRREEITALASRRFSYMRQGEQLVIGNADEISQHFNALKALGVERFYVWFADFAAPATLASFGRDVIPAVSDS
jgi:alkanesulfonate monooxygenase SsuD/methylene tetrahydromethanopterin reductase-like flavin-dependent oxidoreductase (luciferase family)